MGKLSDTFVRSAKPGAYTDGDGLMLFATVKSKRWVLRYQVSGRRRDMGLGTYPAVKLADARRLESEAKGKIAAGVDPIDARSASRQADKPIPTFGEIAELVIAAEEAKGANTKGLAQLRRYLGPLYVDRWLKKPVNSISSVDVLELLAPIRRQKPEACRKLYPAIRKVFAHARIRLRDENGIEFVNPAHWDDLKAMGYAAPDRLTQGSHPSAQYSMMPAIMVAIRQSDHTAARMLELTILTNVRTDSTRFARAEDIDWEEKIWPIPPAHLKDKKTRGAKPFRIPLTARAFEIVEAFKPKSGKGLLFAKPDGGAFSYAFMMNHLHSLNGDPEQWVDEHSGRPIVVHGFRATFMTWANAAQSFPSDVVREAMGRVIGNTVDRVYSRGDLMELRRPLMENWAMQCIPHEGNIVAFPKGTRS